MSIEEGNGVENKVEGGVEKFPNRVEVFDFLGLDSEKCSITKEEYEESVLKLLEFKTEANEEGQIAEYLYTRSMKSAEGAPHFGELETDLYKTVYDANGDFVTYPENTHRYKNGAWEKL